MFLAGKCISVEEEFSCRINYVLVVELSNPSAVERHSGVLSCRRIWFLSIDVGIVNKKSCCLFATARGEEGSMCCYQQ